MDTTYNYITTSGPATVGGPVEMDAAWILTTIFIIFTMHTGFALLEVGFVHPKNEVNAMLKCCADVVLSGLSYWLFGYGLSFGSPGYNNPFCGEGSFLTRMDGDGLGKLYLTYLFQLAFALTSTTIVSGAVAERTSMTGKFVLAFVSTIVYVIPAHWMWGENGWLLKYGAFDFAGSGVVHLSGAMLAIVASIIIGPRKGRYDKGNDAPPMYNATNALVGTFILWWGWIGFNGGSSFGISDNRWQFAGKAVIATLNASFAAGTVALIISYFFRKRTYNVADFITGLLGGLVAITAGCAVVQPWEGIIIGAIASVLCIATVPLLDLLKIDDPVGAFAVHGTGGIWGMLAVGFFADADSVGTLLGTTKGVFRGGGQLLLSQFVAVLSIIAWSGVISFLLVIVIHLTIGLRQTDEEQEIGADYVEHDIVPKQGIPRYSNGEPVIERYHPFTLWGRKCKCLKDDDRNEAHINEAYNSSNL